MDIGGIVSGTFAMLKARFGQLLGLWAVYFGITIALFAAMAIAAGTAGIAGFAAMDGGANPLMAGGAMIAVVAVFYLGYVAVALAQYASLTLMASPIRQFTVGEALGAGWRAVPALLLLLVVLVLGYLAAAMLLGIVGAGFAALGDAARGLFALLVIPVAVWLGCRLAPLFAVVAVDGVRNPFAAIARSWRLTRGHALTIFLASLVFVVILVVVCGLALLPSIGVLRSMSDPALADGGAGVPALGGLVLLMVGGLATSVLFNLIYCAFLAVLHGTLTDGAGEAAAEAFA